MMACYKFIYTCILVCIFDCVGRVHYTFILFRRVNYKKNYAYILNIILFNFLFIQKKMKVSVSVIFAADKIESGMMTL